MAFDGIMTYALCREFNNILPGGKIEKVTQPEKDDIVLHLHIPGSKERNKRLLLSANPSAPRACLTAAQFENPAVPPNFCMLLRKHLCGSRIVDISQPGFERVLIFTFECYTEMREMVRKHLILEIMGKWSNLVLTDDENKIIDALRPVDFSVSEKRQLFPGLKYKFPPSQNKADLSEDVHISFAGDDSLDKFLTLSFTGFSPLLSREISYGLTGNVDCRFCDNDKLNIRLQELYRDITSGKFVFCVLFAEKPVEFYCFDINQYSGLAEKKYYATASEAIDAFYNERRQKEHLKHSAADVTKILNTHISRLSRKINAQLSELSECEKAEQYKRLGDIITGSIYMIKKGDGKVLLPDYYANGELTQIELDKRLTPAENAQKYYKLYKKSVTAKKVLSEQIPVAQAELEYLESVLVSVDSAENSADISQIRQELVLGGYIKTTYKNYKEKCDNEPSKYLLSDGFTAFSGKNNLQNDILTLKMAQKQDIWFHVKNYPGSHVVLVCNGRIPSDRALTEAAIIAATNSKIKDSENVEVDYTQIKNVKKPSGSRPGKVIYENYKTAIVSPDKGLINELIVKK